MSLADYACADEPAHIFAYHADALVFLRSLPDEWVPAIICDPPYGLADHKASVVATAITAWAAGDRERVPTGHGFMGREWDAFVPPPAVWDECLRVLKPGGHLAVFAGSRTVDLMGLSIRLAGFEMRDGIAAWLYGSGFPKSLDVGKAIDKHGGDSSGVLGQMAETLRSAREVRGLTVSDCDRLFCDGSTAWPFYEGRTFKGRTHIQPPRPERAAEIVEAWPETREVFARLDLVGEVVGTVTHARSGGEDFAKRPGERGVARTVDVTAPATDAAREWSGWGTALKPAHEPILLARKPLAGTVAANVLAHGAGAMNIDACRVGTVSEGPGTTPKSSTGGARGSMEGGPVERVEYDGSAGRWPTNVVLAHHPECRETSETRAVKGAGSHTRHATTSIGDGAILNGGGSIETSGHGIGHVEHMAVFECHPDCQVAALDEQSGTLEQGHVSRNRQSGKAGTAAFGDFAGTGASAGYTDSGGASRFFPTFRYQAKAPKSERPIVDGTGHPTVKPLGLMRWLVRLLVPGEDGEGGCGAVLDPFAGSGATLEAARLEGRRAIGVERDEHSVRLIAERLGVEYREPPAPVEVPAPEVEVPVPVVPDDARARRNALATKLRDRAEEVVATTSGDPALATRHALATKLLTRAEEVIAETCDDEAIPA